MQRSRQTIVAAVAAVLAPSMAFGQTVISSFTEDFEDGNAGTRWTLTSRESNGTAPASLIGDGSANFNAEIATTPAPVLFSPYTVGTVPAGLSGGTRAVTVTANDNDELARLAKSAITPNNFIVSGDFRARVDVFASFSDPTLAGSSEFIMIGLNTDTTDPNVAPTRVTGPTLAALNSDPLNAQSGYSFHLANEGGYAGDVRFYAAEANDDGPNFAKRNAGWTGTYSQYVRNGSNEYTGGRTTPGEMNFNTYYDTVFPASQGFLDEGTPGGKWYQSELVQRGNIVTFLANGRVIGSIFTEAPRAGRVSLGVYDAASSIPPVASRPQSYIMFDNVQIDQLSGAPLNTLSNSDTYAVFNSGATETVNGAFAMTGLSFDSASTTLAGTGAITLGGEGYAAVYANAGNHVVSKPIVVNSGISVYVDQGDSLDLTSVSYGEDSRDFHKLGRGMLRIGQIRTRSLTISTGPLKLIAGTSKVEHLIFGYGPTASNGDATLLDVGRSVLAIDYPAGPLATGVTTLSPLASIADRLNTGFAGGAWNGPGIISSDILAAGEDFTIRLAEASALGYTDGSTWAGTTIDASTVLFGFTSVADFDLDQTVGFSDLLRVARNYNAIDLDPFTSYYFGDTNGDGAVNFIDLLALARAYGTTISASGEIVVDAATNASFSADWALAVSMVPEPATLGVLAGASVLGLRRRR